MSCEALDAACLVETHYKSSFLEPLQGSPTGVCYFFFFNDTATTEIYTLSLHDALPISCGHDTHTAMLMGVAEVLAGMRNDLPGTVKFIFQPAEEGAPAGEQGGAELMITEGALENPKPDAIFGLHVFPYPAGDIRYRAGPIMASADEFHIVVRGRQTHGAIPWAGIDPVVIASQIVLGLQTIVSRQVDLTAAPAIGAVGVINAGVRYNIIPDSVVMSGTIRTFDGDRKSTRLNSSH